MSQFEVGSQVSERVDPLINPHWRGEPWLPAGTVIGHAVSKSGTPLTVVEDEQGLFIVYPTDDLKGT